MEQGISGQSLRATPHRILYNRNSELFSLFPQSAEFATQVGKKLLSPV